jgi:hypothetical protein
VTLDPLISVTLRAFVGTLFALAAIHKMIGFRSFSITLSKYLRGSLRAADRPIVAIGVLVVAVELAIGAACALLSTAVAAAGAAIVLLSYAAAMYFNLRRGNVLLDCGCSWGARRQPLRRALVIRNLCLALLALTMAVPAGARTLTTVDIISVFATLGVAAALYSAVNLLLALSPSSLEVR